MTVVGDTSAVVTLRNILDRETISVLDEASSLLGPLQRFARAAALDWERRAERLRAVLWRRRRRTAIGPRDGRGGDHGFASAEIEALKTRLSKIEARQRRKEGAAA